MLNIWSESRINEQFIPYSLNFKSFWTRYSILDSKKELLDSKKNYLDSSNIGEIRWRNVINKRRRIDIVGVIFTTYVNERWFIERHARDETIVKKVSQEVVVDSKREYRKGKRPWWPCATRKFLSIRECTFRSSVTRQHERERASSVKNFLHFHRVTFAKKEY